MMVFRRTFLRAALGLPLVAVLPGLLHAEGPDEAQRFVGALAHRAISTVADPQLSRSERDERFRNLFVTAVDLPEIGRFVLSRYWRNATADEQQEFLRLFEDITVLNLGEAFPGL